MKVLTYDITGTIEVEVEDLDYYKLKSGLDCDHLENSDFLTLYFLENPQALFISDINEIT